MKAAFALMLGVCCWWNAAHAQNNAIISGRVLDFEGKPVANAQVYYYPNLMAAWLGVSPDSIPYTTTDERGRYRLASVLPPSIVSAIIAFHPTAGCSTIRFGAKPATNLRLQPLKEFVGKVVNVKGQPIAGAQVRLTYISVGVGSERDEMIVPPAVPPFATTTDAQGEFRLPIHPKTNGFGVLCTASGYEPVMQTPSTSWDKLTKEGLTFTLKPGARITAQLVYAHNGEPCRGYPVRVGAILHTLTDETGRIAQDVSAGSVLLMPGVSISSATLVPTGWFAPVQVKDLKPGTTTDLGVIKVFTEPQVTIEVRDDKDKPVPFCAVDIRPAETPNMGMEVPYFTDSKGRLTIVLPDGEYRLSASGLASEEAYYTSHGEHSLSVREGRLAVSQPLVLRVTTARMSRVREVKMQVRTSRNKIPKTIWTNLSDLPEGVEVGRRPYRLDGGHLVVQVSSDRTGQMVILDYGTQEGAVIRNFGSRSLPSLIRLQPLPKVRGRVVDDTGKPVVGAKVRLILGQEWEYRISDGGSESTWRAWSEYQTPLSGNTSQTGSFMLPIVPEGRCWAVVTAHGYEPAAAILNVGQTATIRLKKALAEYTGMLVDDYGEPVAKAQLLLLYEFPEGRTPRNYQQRRVPMQAITLGTVTTDEWGRFSLKAMPSSLLLTLRPQDLSVRPIPVKPARDLILSVPSMVSTWKPADAASAPNVEKLLRRVEWLQPVQWEGKNTLLVFTAPYLAQNQQCLQTIKEQMRMGWQVAIVLDTASRQEAERFRRQVPLDVAVGFWKRSARQPVVPALPRILPTVPYIVYMGEDGKLQQQGITMDELPKVFGVLP
jgi:uncharacterized GH25 family protein